MNKTDMMHLMHLIHQISKASWEINWNEIQKDYCSIVTGGFVVKFKSDSVGLPGIGNEKKLIVVSIKSLASGELLYCKDYDEKTVEYPLLEGIITGANKGMKKYECKVSEVLGSIIPEKFVF